MAPPVVTSPEVTESGFGSLTASGLGTSDRERWTQRIASAAVTVQNADLDSDWDGRLAVVIATDSADFAVRAGTPADTASAVTACSGSSSVIVVNPVVLGSGDEWLTSTLVHEGVHVATGSACVAPGKGIGWANEGLAESVAADADPATASRNRTLVLAYLAEHGVPSALPERLDTLTDYALAQLAVDELIDHLGERSDAFLRRAIHDAEAVTPAELDKVRGWYVAALRQLDS